MPKTETQYMRLKKINIELQHWYGMARMDAASLSRTLKKVEELENLKRATQLETVRGVIEADKVELENTELSQ